MTAISYHTPDALLAAYAMGSLSQPFALVVATHISLCLDCRAGFEAHQAAGGLVLEAAAAQPVTFALKSRVLDRLDSSVPPQASFARMGVFPGPVAASLQGKQPNWRSVGMGVRQSILSADHEGSVRLLYIPPGQAVPDHSHGGLELTLVLQGSFHDCTGHYRVGDLEVADQDLEHTPIADPGPPCICLAATDAPLRFTGWMPRVLLSFIRI